MLISIEREERKRSHAGGGPVTQSSYRTIWHGDGELLNRNGQSFSRAKMT